MAKLESLDSKTLQKVEDLANGYRYVNRTLDRLAEAFEIMRPNIHCDCPMKKEDAITVFSAMESAEFYVLDKYYDYYEKIIKLLPKKDTWYILNYTFKEKIRHTSEGKIEIEKWEDGDNWY